MCSLGCLPSQLSLGLLSHGLLRGSHRTVPGTGCSHTGRPLGRSCPAALPIKTNSKSRVLDPLLKATGLQESLCFITKAPYLNSDVSLNGSPFRVQCVTQPPHLILCHPKTEMQFLQVRLLFVTHWSFRSRVCLPCLVLSA